jgi:hypothetical protein
VDRRVVHPDEGAGARWRELAEVYRGLHDDLQDRMHRLGALDRLSTLEGVSDR